MVCEKCTFNFSLKFFFIGEKKLSKVITPDVAKQPIYKTPKDSEKSSSVPQANKFKD